jgi:hypothetical protein
MAMPKKTRYRPQYTADARLKLSAMSALALLDVPIGAGALGEATLREDTRFEDGVTAVICLKMLRARP